MFEQRPDALVPAAQELPQNAGTRYLAAEIMEKRGFNPIAKLIDLCEDMEQIDVAEGDIGRHFEKRLKVLTTLAKFYAPQPKSLDLNVKQDSTFTIQTVDYSSLLSERAHLIPLPLNQRVALLGVEETVEAKLDGD